jgi:hypothetical protein
MLEVNRNPEKIRKTVEKNRGSKRSTDTKKLMSERAKGRTPANKGCYYVHNPQTGEKKIAPKRSRNSRRVYKRIWK